MVALFAGLQKTPRVPRSTFSPHNLTTIEAFVPCWKYRRACCSVRPDGQTEGNAMRSRAHACCRRRNTPPDTRVAYRRKLERDALPRIYMHSKTDVHAFLIFIFPQSLLGYGARVRVQGTLSSEGETPTWKRLTTLSKIGHGL